MSKQPEKTSSDNSVLRIKPYQYIHVTDNNSNVARIEVGPQTFTRQEHEKVTLGPVDMLKIPPRHYVKIINPVTRNDKGELVYDKHKNVKLRYGDEEIRFEQEPFPLYPGEESVGKVTALQVVAPNTALRLRAIRDFVDDNKVKRVSGDEWLFEGPETYYPRVEVTVVELIRARVIKNNEALKLRARKATLDKSKISRKAGEEWLVREAGAYLPGVDEEIIDSVQAYVLTESKALHLRARRTFTDQYEKDRQAGEEWLVTCLNNPTHIPDIHEEVIGPVGITVLNNRQYCYVLDPVDSEGKQLLGQKELRSGPRYFFLKPHERLESGIQNVHILGENEALLLRAKASFQEGTITKNPGDRWMIYGPRDYVPPVEVEIVEKRKTIPLDDNEGIYVRDIKTGKVTAKIGSSYMLQSHEELWEKDLHAAVEELISKASQEKTGARDKTRVVSYRAPHNSVVQIYDYKDKKSRHIFGPGLVMLGPDEHFTILSLSGGKPKKAHVIKSISLFLGPDFMTDVVTVETSDHARLALQLSYNWNFIVDKTKDEEIHKLFQVPDFVGDACKAVASRVRGSVAACRFDDFHRNSAKVIRTAVFGVDENGKIKKNLVFSANNLHITNIDIQSVEPVDSRTRDSLQKSVQLAIEITTNSQEAGARHEAQRIEQMAKGKLERQKITDEAEAEKAKKELLQLQAKSAAVESTGQATAEAKARAEAAKIGSQAAVTQATSKAEAAKIQSEQELNAKKAQDKLELDHQKKIDFLEISKAQELSQIESSKFAEIVESIGASTIKSIASAGPELQAKLLQGLGLKSFMITDGTSPINLFNTANGLIGGNVGSSQPKPELEIDI